MLALVPLLCPLLLLCYMNSGTLISVQTLVLLRKVPLLLFGSIGIVTLLQPRCTAVIMTPLPLLFIMYLSPSSAPPLPVLSDQCGSSRPSLLSDTSISPFPHLVISAVGHYY